MAKPSGMPNSLIVTRPALSGRALRASRSSHERRECARCARDRITSAVRGCAAAGGDRFTSMRWCRTSCIQARRCALRLQSREAAMVPHPAGADAELHSRGLRLRGSAAIPLTLLAQRARAAMANAGRKHHTQTAIGLSTPLLGVKRLSCWTAERPIRLERKVGSREATRFPRRVAAVGGPYPEAGVDEGGPMAACSFCADTNLRSVVEF